MNLAFKDDLKNHVQVYVVNRRDSSDFYKYLISNYDMLVNKNNFPLDKEEFIKNNYAKINEKKEKNMINEQDKHTDFDSIIDVEKEWFGE